MTEEETNPKIIEAKKQIKELRKILRIAIIITIPPVALSYIYPKSNELGYILFGSILLFLEWSFLQFHKKKPKQKTTTQATAH